MEKPPGLPDCHAEHRKKSSEMSAFAILPAARGRTGLENLSWQAHSRRHAGLKGFGKVRLQSGNIRKAELHWYEAHGIGKKKMKIKRFLE